MWLSVPRRTSTTQSQRSLVSPTTPPYEDVSHAVYVWPSTRVAYGTGVAPSLWLRSHNTRLFLRLRRPTRMCRMLSTYDQALGSHTELVSLPHYGAPHKLLRSTRVWQWPLGVSIQCPVYGKCEPRNSACTSQSHSRFCPFLEVESCQADCSLPHSWQRH
jgi:hypothetical protein